MKKFKNVISLGSNCYVAKDLERIGYRCASFPFDWLITDFSSVISIISNDFEDFCIEENICQDEEHKNVYHDLKSGVDFYHDFFQNMTISEQFSEVKEKYNRRIKRFNKTISEPTLFLRQIRNKDDFSYALNHYDDIMAVLKRKNSNNECIYIITDEKLFDEKLPQFCYLSKDVYHPIKTGKRLKSYISKTVKMGLKTRLSNLNRYNIKRMKRVLGR